MKILNLGCGSKTSSSEGVVNADKSIYLRVKRNPFLAPLARLVFRGERFDRYQALPDNIVLMDISKGLDFENGFFDVVYHSHVLEHLDKCIVSDFLREIFRVLKPGGIHRIVVPDLEHLCRTYLADLGDCDANPEKTAGHDQYISDIIEQMVRKEASGTSRQTGIRRWAENRLMGDARTRGETHQWMYDRISLARLLEDAGFRTPKVMSFSESGIPSWHALGLDRDVSGKEYKPGSLYIEARK